MTVHGQEQRAAATLRKDMRRRDARARRSSQTRKPNTFSRGQCDSVMAMRRAEAAAVGVLRHGCRRARSRRRRCTAVRRQQQGVETNVRQAEGGRRDGRRRIGPSQEVSQAVRRRSSVGTLESSWETAFGLGVLPFSGARPGRQSASRSKNDERRLWARRQAVQHHARSDRLSSTERRNGPNGSTPKRKNAGAAAASYRRHGSRRHECTGWPTSPSGPPRLRRQRRLTRPRPRGRSTGGRSAADDSR